jgi:AraC-like DNA-binding protein
MTRMPAGQLQSYVSSYVDYDMTGWPPGRHRGLPDGNLGIVVSFGTPPRVRRAGYADITAAATVAGLRADPVDILHDGTQRGVQIELTPCGARALLGLPAAALAQGVWSLDEIVGRRSDELIDRLSDASGAEERVRVLDEVLASWVSASVYPVAVDVAWRQLVASAGSASVASVASHTGLSRRHLGELLRAEIGLTPKTASRILRFARARRSLRSGRTTSLAETAAICGYFDQAHLSNDWRRIAGCTPGEWIAEELPFLQDEGRVDDRN